MKFKANLIVATLMVDGDFKKWEIGSTLPTSTVVDLEVEESLQEWKEPIDEDGVKDAIKKLSHLYSFQNPNSVLLWYEVDEDEEHIDKIVMTEDDENDMCKPVMELVAIN